MAAVGVTLFARRQPTIRVLSWRRRGGLPRSWTLGEVHPVDQFCPYTYCMSKRAPCQAIRVAYTASVPPQAALIGHVEAPDADQRRSRHLTLRGSRGLRLAWDRNQQHHIPRPTHRTPEAALKPRERKASAARPDQRAHVELLAVAAAPCRPAFRPRTER